MVVLMFPFLNLKVFMGLGFGLLTLAAKALDPLQSKVLLVSLI